MLNILIQDLLEDGIYEPTWFDGCCNHMCIICMYNKCNICIVRRIWYHNGMFINTSGLSSFKKVTKIITCPSCENNTSGLWDISDLNTEFDEVCFSCKYDIQSELADELDSEQTMQDLYVWSCQF